MGGHDCETTNQYKENTLAGLPDVMDGLEDPNENELPLP